MKTKNKNSSLEELISRENYLVVQGNDLAKSFGNLKSFEHKILDYCFSLVKKESLPNEIFRVSTTDIIKFFRINDSGENYRRIAEAFKTLNENTALYLPKVSTNGEKSIVMTQLFSYIEFYENGQIEFEFSEKSKPYVFELKNNFYSFHLRELSYIKGKYSLILLKLWESNRHGNNQLTVIDGTLDEWQSWFLGRERRLSPGEFKRSIIGKAINEIEKKLNSDITLITKKKGRNVTGYTMEIIAGHKK